MGSWYGIRSIMLGNMLQLHSGIQKMIYYNCGNMEQWKYLVKFLFADWISVSNWRENQPNNYNSTNPERKKKTTN